MTNQPLTYVEKLENLYVLLETRNMLEHKLNHVYTAEHSDEIRADIQTINEEIMSYCDDGIPIETIDLNITKSLFNPAVYFDDSTE